MSKDSELFCSQCKFSQYVTYSGKKTLWCSVHRKFFPTDVTHAESCSSFSYEYWRYNLTTRRDYIHKMKKCGIPLFLEKLGKLADVKLH